ncbi:MAG: protein-L-isoaspartate O-methyltransferase [Kangiellaceae bacterium]|nr:protein-L-isoaspartate O-methyltransferase [Kangiellaceae bacterium]|tara:strand:+ start:8129 stop:8788 length:660 start_codon:yes stop_codon:yes gene_type:complete
MIERERIGSISERARQRIKERLTDMGITHQQLVEVMADVPRELFVEQALAHKSYENTALPIGRGQTISQLTTVARMTELLLDAPGGKILEVGTGCGYQTAVLSQLFADVYSIERIKSLQQQARVRLRKLKISNVRFKHGDGWQGWDESAPYDGIIITACPTSLPQGLVPQLKEGGVIVCPIEENTTQYLYRGVKKGDDVELERLDEVRFVPLIPGEVEV